MFTLLSHYCEIVFYCNNLLNKDSHCSHTLSNIGLIDDEEKVNNYLVKDDGKINYKMLFIFRLFMRHL